MDENAFNRGWQAFENLPSDERKNICFNYSYCREMLSMAYRRGKDVTLDVEQKIAVISQSIRFSSSSEEGIKHFNMVRNILDHCEDNATKAMNLSLLGNAIVDSKIENICERKNTEALFNEAFNIMKKQGNTHENVDVFKSIIKGYVKFDVLLAKKHVNLLANDNLYKISALCFLAKNQCGQNEKSAVKSLKKAVKLIEKSPLSFTKEICKVVDAISYLKNSNNINSIFPRASIVASKAAINNDISYVCSVYKVSGKLEDFNRISNKLMDLPNGKNYEANNASQLMKAGKTFILKDSAQAFGYFCLAEKAIARYDHEFTQVKLISKLYDIVCKDRPEYAREIHSQGMSYIDKIKDDKDKFKAFAMLTKPHLK
jgi:hypothetical protein